MGVRRPAWLFYPLECEHGHEWGPGRVLVSWQLGWKTPGEVRHFPLAQRDEAIAWAAG
jgi:hypothetical protein